MNVDLQFDKKDFKCSVCNKKYVSNKSLWNHRNKLHNDSIVKKTENAIKIYNCRKCNKTYNNKQSRWSHEKVCKNNSTNRIESLENTVNELKNQLALIVEEKGKVHHKTLQKINNQLNNQLNNINNGNIINNTYVKFGDVEYEKILDNMQIKQILNKQHQSLEESIKQIHFNKDLPEYSNIFITNMKDDLAYVFDGKQFISIRKNEMLNELIDVHTKEINLSLEKNKCDMNQKQVVRLEKFLDMLNDDDTKFTDEENMRTYPSYKAYKINSIKLMIYNNSDKKKLDTLNTMELEQPSNHGITREQQVSLG